MMLDEFSRLGILDELVGRYRRFLDSRLDFATRKSKKKPTRARVVSLEDFRKMKG
jgi:hypothetical protein